VLVIDPGQVMEAAVTACDSFIHTSRDSFTLVFIVCAAPSARGVWWSAHLTTTAYDTQRFVICARLEAPGVVQ